MMIFKIAVLLWIASALTACGSSSGDELRQWMAAQRALAQPKVNPIAEPKQFKPENYTVVNEADPFSKQKLTHALGKESNLAAANGALIAPELKRRKEPLEEFPLDTMSLVGGMVRNQKPVALVKVGPLLYQVRPGDYLGQNYGRVVKIFENEITLREIVQDAVGEWIERPASLMLQERSK